MKIVANREIIVNREKKIGPNSTHTHTHTRLSLVFYSRKYTLTHLLTHAPTAAAAEKCVLKNRLFTITKLHTHTHTRLFVIVIIIIVFNGVQEEKEKPLGSVGIIVLWLHNSLPRH